MKRQIAGIARFCLGRRNLVRVGRFLMNSGMLRFGNSIDSNGELRLLAELIAGSQKSPVIIDIGANVGEYSTQASKLLNGTGRIYSAEPCNKTHQDLIKNTTGLPTAINYLKLAFSDSCGQTELFVVANGAGTNSLEKDTTIANTTEWVERTTLDAFLDAEKINSVDIVKVDTEGHDFAVIRGAANSLKMGKIGALQFEYNWRWMGQRAYLRDVFNFIKDLDYNIGRVTPRGIELHKQWQPAMETLIEDNYVIIRKDVKAATTYTFELP
jgi:FkbM family methyltransferase